VRECGDHSRGSVYGPLAGFREQGNEILCSKKCADFLYQLSDYELLNKGFVLWSYCIFIVTLKGKKVKLSL
jgi:hypothetical protein